MNNINGIDLPMGFGMALSQNIEAMNKFVSLSADAQMEIINNTHQIKSKSEMRSFVQSLI